MIQFRENCLASGLDVIGGSVGDLLAPHIRQLTIPQIHFKTSEFEEWLHMFNPKVMGCSRSLISSDENFSTFSRVYEA